MGMAVRIADFNKDGKSDLAVGIPYEDVGAIVNAGAVNVWHRSSGVGTLTPAVKWTHAGDVEGTPQTNDLFGWALS